VAAIGNHNLIDVRSPDEYAGRLLAPAHLPQEQAQRPGHIPTALSVPWSKAANEDGTFKSDEDLRKLYAEAGIDDSQPTIAYCRIGERSSHTWFALHAESALGGSAHVLFLTCFGGRGVVVLPDSGAHTNTRVGVRGQASPGSSPTATGTPTSEPYSVQEPS
jgi:rhodanese-related sulfurtransferase